MTRGLRLASLLVVVFAFAGASAGPARPLQSLRLVISVAWLNAPEEGERETQLLAPRVAQPSAFTVSRAPRAVGFRSFPNERWLFQRPPPATL
ncbi:MAG TPA: hypothetical protein VH436_30865 [Vicinamibacterales bacterium]|jgi:hypothetical protein